MVSSLGRSAASFASSVPPAFGESPFTWCSTTPNAGCMPKSWRKPHMSGIHLIIADATTSTTATTATSAFRYLFRSAILGFSYIPWPHILPIHPQYYPTSSPVLRCPSCFPSPSLHTFLSPTGIARAYQDWRKRGRCNPGQRSFGKATSAKPPACELTRSPLNHKRVKGCIHRP